MSGKRWVQNIYQPHKIDKFPQKVCSEKMTGSQRNPYKDIFGLSLFLFDCFLSFSRCKVQQQQQQSLFTFRFRIIIVTEGSFSLTVSYIQYNKREN